MSESHWHYRYFCQCGHYHCRATGGSYFMATVHGDLCHACGRRVSMANGRIRRTRWKSSAVWWRPSTWGRGHWQTRDTGEAEA